MQKSLDFQASMESNRQQGIVKKSREQIKPVLAGLRRQAGRLALRELSLVVGDRTFELITNLVMLVLVERTCGQSGLGIYSYLLSLYTLAAYLAEWGIPHYLERETALQSDSATDQASLLENAFRAVLILGGFAALLLLASSAYDTSSTRIEEKIGAYLLIGLAIPVRNINRLRLASLNGQGRHGEAAGLHWQKRIAFIATVVVLLKLQVQPSYLAAGFLLSELFLALIGRKKLRLPSVRTVLSGLDRLRDTLREGSRVLFTDDALDVVLYVDILVLGFFMSSRDLGVYAEASVFARFFLIIPTSLRPVFLRRFCLFTAQCEDFRAFSLAHRVVKHLFSVQSLLVLYMLLFYPAALRFFFETRGEELLSFRVFEVLAPGLLFSSSMVVIEPLYEATGRVDTLKRIMLTVFCANLILNVFLVPVSGLFGAACATSFSMMLHCVMLGACLAGPHRLKINTGLTAGCTVFLTYRMMEPLDAGVLSILLTPVLLGSLFFVTGFFVVGEVAAVQPQCKESLQGGEADAGRE
jgi:O-antigen/teichoic acid export membrane protein